MWKAYLSTLEVGRREEDILSPAEMDTFSAEECAVVLFSMASKKKYPLLKFALKASICMLSPRQKEVIVSHYWKGKTITEIAASMGLSKQAVFKTMKAALSKLKENLINGALQKRVVVVREATSILGLTRG